MKILVTNHWLEKIGGSETFVFTLLKALQLHGHEVSFFTFKEGIVSRKLQQAGFKLISAESNKEFDLILANHHTTVDLFQGRAFIIQTIHGLTPKLEKPSKVANHYVAISQEIKSSLIFDSTLVWNGIDCDRFFPRFRINKKIKRVLSLVHSDQLNERLKMIFEKRKVKFHSFNKFRNPVWDIETYINQSDLIISLGRGAYEAMACGRPVLILDGRKYQEEIGDGFLTPAILPQSIFFNCSGRCFKRKDIENMVDESFQIYNQAGEAEYLSDFFRSYALNNLNMSIQSKKYLSIYENRWDLKDPE